VIPLLLSSGASLLVLVAVAVCACEASQCRPHPLYGGGVDLLDRPARRRP
jgi:hypothetical protein